MKPIFIIGYMASGKTTLGRNLARSLGLDFIDLDFFIEQRFRLSIPKIFEEKGEDWFRCKEGNLLREVGEFEDVVISCGGGTPCFGDNMEFMISRGITVWVNSSIDCIVRRLMMARVQRPLVVGKSAGELREYVERHLETRLADYSRARIEFQGDELENRNEIDRSVRRLLPILKQALEANEASNLG